MSEKNEIALTKIQQYQVKVIQEITETLKKSDCEVSPYGQKCMTNAIAGVVSYLKSNGKSFEDINLDLFKINIQNIGLLELNYASIPAELYVDVHGDVLTLKPQGAGNEKLTRKYGVNVADLSQPWLVREGDEFTLPSFDGEKVNPPKWVMKSLDKKVIAVVYMLTKTDGTKEWLIAGREEVASNLIAQIRQNALYKFYKKDENGKDVYDKKNKRVIDTDAREEFYDSLNDRTLEDLLNDKSLREYISPSYLSGGSKEQMIIRKMKNNALKNYPREYDNAFVRDAVVDMFEEKDSTIIEKPEEVVDVEVKESAPKDFKVNEDGEIVKETETSKEEVKVEQPKPVEEKKVEVVKEQPKEDIPQSPGPQWEKPTYHEEDEDESNDEEENDSMEDFGF